MDITIFEKRKARQQTKAVPRARRLSPFGNDDRTIDLWLDNPEALRERRLRQRQLATPTRAHTFACHSKMSDLTGIDFTAMYHARADPAAKAAAQREDSKERRVLHFCSFFLNSLFSVTLSLMRVSLLTAKILYCLQIALFGGISHALILTSNDVVCGRVCCALNRRSTIEDEELVKPHYCGRVLLCLF